MAKSSSRTASKKKASTGKSSKAAPSPYPYELSIEFPNVPGEPPLIFHGPHTHSLISPVTVKGFKVTRRISGGQLTLKMKFN